MPHVTPPDDRTAPPPRIPDFELFRSIGRGSYGEVWLARSVTGAWRAVKIVRRSRFDSARPYDREFEGIQKYEPVSRSTEGLVHLLHVSRSEEFFYYVMELADATDSRVESPSELGVEESRPSAVVSSQLSSQTPVHSYICSYTPRTLASELKQHRRLPFAQCLRITLALAKGLEHLHASGLIHRDLKPSNIIFVNDSPRLADIGLVTDADSTRTLVGTEGYLPPDGGGTASADLYSLGKVLYEMSTGLDRQEFPVMPPDFANLPDRAQLLELSEIFEKACEAIPADRYASAAELRADLELLQAGQSVVRRRRHGWFLRQLGRAAIIAVVASAFVAGGWLWRQQTHPKPETAVRDASASVKAVSAYRQGRTAIEQRTRKEFTNALAYFDEALRVDSTFAPAQAGRAEALALLASYDASRSATLWQQAREAAEAALQQVPDLPAAQLTLGLIKLNHEWDWAGAEAHFRAGLAGEPGSAEGHLRLASVLGVLGRCDEAVAEARRAVELEPAARGANFSLGLQLYHARRYEAAVAQLRRTLALTPDFASARLLLARVLFQMERAPEGMNERLALLNFNGGSNPAVRQLIAARDQFGPAGFWRKRLDQLRNSGESFELARAEAHVRLGDFTEAIQALENAVNQRDPSAIYLGVDPLHDPLRTNAVFVALCARLGLPGSAAAPLPFTASPPLTATDQGAGITPDEMAAGFRLIFDGATLQGWSSDQTNWTVRDGALERTRPRGGKPSHLRYVTETVPDDFELRFEWKVGTNGSSGVNYRPGLVEYQVIDNAHPDAARSATARSGALYGCIGAQKGDPGRPVGEWNEGWIICQGTTIEHWVNGQKQFRIDYRSPNFTTHLAALDFHENKLLNTSFGNVRARGGYLSLQDEGVPGAAFRRLRWRKLE